MRPTYAGFWLRFVADLIDSTLLTIASWLLEYLLLGVFYVAWGFFLGRMGQATPPFSESFNAFFLQMFNLGIYLCLAFPYYTWAHYKFGTTLGKKPLRIRVVQAGSLAAITIQQSIYRTLGYVASYLPFCAGFLMAAFHPQKRALHDLIAGTVSIREEKR